MSRIACVLVLALLALPVFAQSRTGPVRVVDGDTLVMSGERIRLYGINAPESSQACDNGRWACGTAATQALRELVAGRPVSCQARDRDAYGRTVAVCRNAAGQDLSGAMAAQGMAMAYRRYSMAYVPEETAARQQGLGVWAGQFQDPEAYRHGLAPAAEAAGASLSRMRNFIGQLIQASAAPPQAGGGYPREGVGYNNFDGSGGQAPAQLEAAPSAPAPMDDAAGDASNPTCALARMLGRACP